MSPKHTTRAQKGLADGFKDHASTKRRILLKYWLFGRGGAKKPLLTMKQISIRFKRCKTKKKKYNVSLEESDVQQ